jgi:hypothetical protein
MHGDKMTHANLHIFPFSNWLKRFNEIWMFLRWSQISRIDRKLQNLKLIFWDTEKTKIDFQLVFTESIYHFSYIEKKKIELSKNQIMKKHNFEKSSTFHDH